MFGEHQLFLLSMCFFFPPSDADYQVMATHKTYSMDLKIATWTSF